MLIDCDACAMQHTSACEDCVVTYLLDAGPFDLAPAEQAALEELADVGLVPRLRLVPRQGPEVEAC